MSLQVGDAAPAFDVTSSDGKKLRLEDFRGKKNVVLYFYPKDFTPGCTAEACGFRDQYADLQTRDTEVIGVSLDSDGKHEDFKKKHNLPFPLVADHDKKLAKAYGAMGFLLGLAGVTKRITFVIDKQGKVAATFDKLLDAGHHLDGVKAAVAKLS